MIQKIEDIKAYTAAHDLAMDIFRTSMYFPKEEKYSLTDQIRRSSRSSASNIAEGWGKRIYPQNFKKHLVDSLGSIEETKSWLLFARDCKYIEDKVYNELRTKLELVGSMVWKLHENWKG